MNNVTKIVQKFVKERDWDNQPPGDIAKSIIIEAAELLEKFQWSDFFAENAAMDPEVKKEIIDELADVFVYAIEMAIILDCDIETIVKNKLAKAAKKYPANVVKGKLGSKKYWEIKKKHRAGK